MAERRTVRPTTIAWGLAACLAAVTGWAAGARALGPMTVPGPTTTVTRASTVPMVPPQTVDPGWSADPASPLPAGIPEGRTEVKRLRLGRYVGIPANAGHLCQWRREGPPDSRGAPAVNEQGSSSGMVHMTLRTVDEWFVSEGCQWKWLGPAR